jgi:hypothetical protein
MMLTLAVSWALGAPPAWGVQGIPGDRFQVNLVNWGGDQTNPDVAVQADGGFMIVWEDPVNSGDIYCYAWRPDFPTAPDGRVHQETAGTQEEPAVAPLSNGTYVVVWTDVSVASDRSTRAQLLDASGARIGSSFQVNQYIAGLMLAADVAPMGDGFVAVWSTSAGPPGPGADGDVRLDGRTFAANGTPLLGEFQLNIGIAGWQVSGAVGEKPLFGGFDAAWVTDPSPMVAPADDRSIVGRSADASGALAPVETVVASSLEVGSPDVAYTPIDNHMVVWEQGTGFSARSYSRFVAGNSFTDASGSGSARPHAAAIGDNYVITHTNNGSVQWQFVDGVVFEQGGGVLSGVGAEVGDHAVASFPWGGFISVWDEGAMTSTIPGGYDADRGICAVVVALDLIFADGFEFEGTANWDVVVP